VVEGLKQMVSIVWWMHMNEKDLINKVSESLREVRYLK
jgi:hypothetical protein